MRTVHSRTASPGGHRVAFYCGSGGRQVSTGSINFIYCGARFMGLDGREVLHATGHRAWMVNGGVFDGIRPTLLVCPG